MLNIIKADLYRILRGKAVYINYLLMSLLFILSVFGTTGGVVITTFADLQTPDKITGILAPFQNMKMTDNIAYFMLTIIICVAAADFSSGSIKNVLSQGISRTKLYMAKWLLVAIFTAFSMLLNIFIPMIFATILNGFGGSVTIVFIRSLLLSAVIQYLLLLAIISMGIFFVFVTKRSAAVIGSYIGFCTVPMILIALLTLINNWFEKLFHYDIISNIRYTYDIRLISEEDIIRTVLISIFYIAISIAGGLFLFNKSEIK